MRPRFSYPNQGSASVKTPITLSTLGLSWALLLPMVSQGQSVPNPIEHAVEQHIVGQTRAAQDQQTINRLDDEHQALLEEYRQLEHQLTYQQRSNQQLQALINTQQQQLNQLDQALEQVAATHTQLPPLILQMLALLEDFVTLDLPFQQAERQAALAGLQQQISQGDLSLAQQYQSVLESYRSEWQNSLRFHHYRDQLPSQQAIDVLGIGRLALYYSTLDGQQVGYWDKQHNQWQPLSNRHRLAIQQGLRIAREQAAPDLLSLPLSTEQEVQP